MIITLKIAQLKTKIDNLAKNMSKQNPPKVTSAMSQMPHMSKFANANLANANTANAKSANAKIPTLINTAIKSTFASSWANVVAKNANVETSI